MTTMTCPNCGERFAAEGAEFCPGADCGYPVDFMTQPVDGTTEDVGGEEEGVLRRPEEQASDTTARDAAARETEGTSEATEDTKPPVETSQASTSETPTTRFPKETGSWASDDERSQVDRGPRRVPPRGVVAGIGAVVVLLGALGTWAVLSGPPADTDEVVIGRTAPTGTGERDADPDPDPGDAGDPGNAGDPGDPPTLEVAVFFADSAAVANDDPPFVRPVPRQIPHPDVDAGVGRNTLGALLQGPTDEEAAAGLVLVTSGISGIGALDRVGNVFVVQLAGGCDHGDLPVTIADLVTPSLKQFATVDFVRILDAQGNTQRPGEAADSIPDCLDRGA